MLTQSFLKRPFLFILIPYVIGLLIGRYLHPQLPYLPILFFIGLLIALLFALIFAPLSFFLLSISLCLLGILNYERVLNPELPPHHISRIADGRSIFLEGSLYRPPETLLSKKRLYVEVERAFSSDRIEAVTGRLLVTVGDKDGSLEDLLSYGDRIRFKARIKKPRNFGNPGEFDYEGYLAGKGIYATGYVEDSGWVARIGGSSPPFAERLRDRIREFIKRGTEGDIKGVIKALILGEKGEISKAIREVFIRTGTAHLLAISGLHIGIVGFIAFSIITLILKRSEYILLTFNIKKVAALITIIPVAIYALIAGFSIPTQRAFIFAVIFIIAVLMDRERDYYNCLAIAAFLILLFEPFSLFQPSFQLSFMAVLSILLFAPFIEEKKGEARISGRQRITLTLKVWTRNLFLISLFTFLSTAPILLYHFYRISPAGLIANIFAIPLIGFIALPSLLSSAFLSLLSYKIAFPLLTLSSLILDYTIKLLAYLSELSWASFYLSTPSIMSIGVYYATILSSPTLLKRGVKKGIILTILPAIACIYLVLSPLMRAREDNLKVTFISIGQGDSTLIEFPGGKIMLIDGGGFYSDDFDVGERILVPFLLRKGIGRIDYIVLSHPQRDHLEGLIFVAKNFEVGEFWWNGDVNDSEVFRELMEVLRGRGVKVFKLDNSLSPFSVNNVEVKVLHPLKQTGFKGNNRSIVLQLKFGRISFLFTGDIEDEVEGYLIDSGVSLKSTILKVPHHGSSTSSSMRFLEEVKPEVAIISSGYMNPFGFPHKSVVERYSKIGIKPLRTDEVGAITVVTDGKRYIVETYR